MPRASLPASFVGAAPLAIAARRRGLCPARHGRGAHACCATARPARHRAAEQIAGLRALVDEYEALLSGTREVTVLWTENADGGPRFLGQASAVLPPGRQPESVLDFPAGSRRPMPTSWRALLEDLRVQRPCLRRLTLNALDGRLIRANGWVLGGGAAMRLRPALLQPGAETDAGGGRRNGDLDQRAHRPRRAAATRPSLRDGNGRLVYANAAYLDLAKALGKTAARRSRPNCSIPPSSSSICRLRAMRQAAAAAGVLAEAGAFELVEFPVAGGSRRLSAPAEDDAASPPTPGCAHLSGIIDALATPDRHLQRQPRTGAVQPRLLRRSGASIRPG